MLLPAAAGVVAPGLLLAALLLGAVPAVPPALLPPNLLHPALRPGGSLQVGSAGRVAPGRADAALPVCWPGGGTAVRAGFGWVPRELPKSAWMTSPPSPVSGDFGAAGVARGTLGRRVAMSLL